MTFLATCHRRSCVLSCDFALISILQSLHHGTASEHYFILRADGVVVRRSAHLRVADRNWSHSVWVGATPACKLAGALTKYLTKASFTRSSGHYQSILLSRLMCGWPLVCGSVRVRHQSGINAGGTVTRRRVFSIGNPH